MTMIGDIDPRKLLYFASIIEHGSLKKAAKHLSISQPALSTSMVRFEQSLGDQLLDRSPTGVTPTRSGEILYAHARLIREELERAKSRLALSGAADAKMVTFGTLPSLATDIVPRAVGLWRADYDTVTLRVVEKNQLDLLLGLIRGELDFIVAQTEFYGILEGMRQRVLFRDRLYVVARPGHPALQIPTPTWAQLADFPWVVQMVGRQRMLLETLLATEDAKMPAQLTEGASVAFIKALISGTDSLAMFPATVILSDVQEGRLVPVPIVEPLLNRDIAVLIRDGEQIARASTDLLEHIEVIGLSHGERDVIPER